MEILPIDQNSDHEEKRRQKLAAAVKSEETTIFGFFLRNFRITYLLIMAILFLGIYSMFTLPREAEPEVKVPYAMVNTVYLGATPKDIEEQITNKIEDKIKDLEGIKQYQSSSNEGFSSIFVEYEPEVELDAALRKLKDAVDEAGSSLPSEAEAPSVKDINFNDVPIVTYSLVGEYSDQELKKYADEMQTRLESIGGVSKVPISGGAEKEFQVLIDQAKLANYKLSLGQAVSAIQGSNFSLPVGNIEIDGFKYSVRVDGKFIAADDLEDVVVSTYNGSPVFLKDVAEIKDTFKEKSTESKIAFKGEETPRNTISLQAHKRTGGNIINIVKEADAEIAAMKAEKVLPDNLAVVKTNDNSKYIKDDLNTLGSSGVQTMVLITVILFLVLSFRGAIITAMSVPFAFLMSFYFLKVQGMTLNSMVLFSLVLSLGLMVDNSIVIIEGISEYITEHKKSAYEAAMLAIWNFKWAVISGTMTTVAAFLPLLLVSGIMGEYMGILPKTLAVTLLSSLFVALVIIPTLASRFIKVKTNGQHSHRDKKRHQMIGKYMSRIREAYVAFLTKLLENKIYRRTAMIAVWALFLLASSIPALGFMKIEMFPKVDADYFSINIELPVGSTMDETKKVLEKVEEAVADLPELDNYVANVGASASSGYGSGGSEGGNYGNVTVNLAPVEQRARKSYEITEALRPEIEKIQGGKATLEELAAGPPSGSPIEVRIFGSDNVAAAELVKKVTAYLEVIPGVINIKNNLENSAGEFTFTVDKQKANYYGLSISSIASSLRNAVYGVKASTVSVDNEDVDITVKYDDEVFVSSNDLENLLLLTPSGAQIPLRQVAEVKFGPSLLSIKHRDGKNIATITADTEKGANATEITNKLLQDKASFNLPDNFTIDVGGEAEDIQQSFTEIFLSLFVAIVLIAFILVLQFNSFKQPFIIMFSLPLALIGVILGLNILRLPFSITVFIGIVSLAGIVVNDAIVLIDKINKNVQDGMTVVPAIVDAGVSRVQPIFLTSITTIAGILPLIFANEMWVGLSLTIVFGLSFSTILTLFIIPVFYYVLCRKDCEKMQADQA